MKNIYYMNKLLVMVILIIILIQTLAISQIKDSSLNQISVNAMVDVYFSKNFNNPLSRINDFRNFDIAEDQFDINLAKITFQKSASPVGFRIDLAFGHAIDLVNSDASLGVEKSLRNIEDAYLTAIIPIGNGLIINAGKMVTHMGAEVIETISNINYSRSILFAYAIPYFHVGACVSYPFSRQFSASFYIYNGWNDVIDKNRDKTLGGEIIWSPSSVFSFIENWIGGPEGADGNASGDKQRNVFDSILNYQIANDLFLTLNIDYGLEALAPTGLAVWKGFALTGKYSINEVSTVGVRSEVYYDQSGFTTGTIQTLKEITLTYEYKFANSLTTRLEFRRDWSDANIFENSTGLFNKNNQNTILIGSVYSL